MASAVHDHETGPMSGRLSVDHKQQLVKLSLIKMMESMNSTMVMSTNGGSLFVYFIINRDEEPEPKPECVAYVLKNIVPDISSSCFPAKQSPMIGSQQAEAPMNVLAYEYAGLAGLFVLQVAASADDCTPTMLSMLTGASNGPQLNVMLSNINGGNSDQSVDNLLQAACAGVTPMNIMVPKNGRFGHRRGSMDSIRTSSDFNRQQWIADMVTMYIVQMIGSNNSPSSPIALKDMLALQELMSQASAEEIMESALKLKLLMQMMSDFMSPSNNNSTMNDSMTLENIIELKITRDLISNLMSRIRQVGNRGENMGNSQDHSLLRDSQDDGPSNGWGDSWGDRQADREDRRNDRRDERDGSDTFNILINQHIISSADSITSEDNTADDNGNMQALISSMIKQKLSAKMQPDGESGPIGNPMSGSTEMTKINFMASLQNVLSRMIQGKISSLGRPQNEMSKPSHGASQQGEHGDESTSFNDKITAMIKQKLLSSMMNDKSGKDGPQRHKRDLRDMMMKKKSDDSSNIDDLVASMVKQEILSNMMPNNDSQKIDLWDVIALMNKQSEPRQDHNRDNGHRNDGSSNIDDLVALMVKQEMLSNMMPKNNGGKLDLWDALALMNKQNDQNINVGDIVVGMAKKEILSSIMQNKNSADADQSNDSALDEVASAVVKKAILSSL